VTTCWTPRAGLPETADLALAITWHGVSPLLPGPGSTPDPARPPRLLLVRSKQRVVADLRLVAEAIARAGTASDAKAITSEMRPCRALRGRYRRRRRARHSGEGRVRTTTAKHLVLHQACDRGVPPRATVARAVRPTREPACRLASRVLSGGRHVSRPREAGRPAQMSKLWREGPNGSNSR
jgi:hypothetical protein